VNHEQRYKHEDTCPYQPVECWAVNWNDTVAKCVWQGKKSDLFDHVKSVHGLQYVHVGPTKEGVEFGAFERSPIRIVLLRALGELFWLTVKHDSDSGVHHGVVHYIGPRSRAALFEYTIEIKFPDGKGKYSHTFPTRTCFENNNEMFDAESFFPATLCTLDMGSINPKKYLPGYKFTVSEVLLPQTYTFVRY